MVKFTRIAQHRLSRSLQTDADYEACIHYCRFPDFRSAVHGCRCCRSGHADGQAEVPDLTKGKAIVNSVCIACHNADGNSVIAGYPVVAQQHPEYMIKQLKEFKSNARKGTVMNGYAAALSDQDMVDVSYYFASQKANKLAATNQETLALGEKIWWVALPAEPCRPVLPATHPTVPACRSSTRAWLARRLTTLSCSSRISVTASARMTWSCRMSSTA